MKKRKGIKTSSGCEIHGWNFINELVFWDRAAFAFCKWRFPVSIFIPVMSVQIPHSPSSKFIMKESVVKYKSGNVFELTYLKTVKRRFFFFFSSSKVGKYFKSSPFLSRPMKIKMRLLKAISEPMVDEENSNPSGRTFSEQPSHSIRTYQRKKKFSLKCRNFLLESHLVWITCQTRHALRIMHVYKF